MPGSYFPPRKVYFKPLSWQLLIFFFWLCDEMSHFFRCMEHKCSTAEHLMHQKSCSGLQTAFYVNYTTKEHLKTVIMTISFIFYLGTKYTISNEMHESRTCCGSESDWGLQDGHFHKWLWGDTKNTFLNLHDYFSLDFRTKIGWKTQQRCIITLSL